MAPVASAHRRPKPGAAPASARDEQREAEAVEHEREHAGRAPAGARGLEAALGPRAAQQRRPRLVGADRQQRQQHEGTQGQGEVAHQVT